MWNLIIIVVALSNSNTAATTAQYESEQACMLAANHVIRKAPTRVDVSAMCSPMGEPAHADRNTRRP